MSVKSILEPKNQFSSVTGGVLEVVPDFLLGPSSETTSTDDLILNLKSGSCPSLTGRSILGFELGCKGESELYLKLVSNTGSGFFSKEWIPCLVIEQLITGATELTSTSFKVIFRNKSVNTGGFVMAVLKELRLLKANVDNSRWHEHVSDMTFERLVAEVAVQEDEVEKSPATKGKRKPKEE